MRGQATLGIPAVGGAPPGKEILDQPDEPDVLDAGDVVDGVGVDRVATGASSASG